MNSLTETELPSGLSIVIPVYNSQENLAELMAALAETLPMLADHFEVWMINDGSRDRSWQTIQELTSSYPWLYGINLMRNYGQHNALLCGIRQCHYATTITMDDDLQHPPAELHKLLELLSAGVDVVYGTPLQEQHGLWRDLASQITKLALQSSMGASTARQVSAWRAFRTQIRQSFANYRSPFVSIDVLLTWGTTRFSSVRVPHHPRKHGQSNYTFGKLVTHALNMLTGFSTVPLELASSLGLLATFFGVLVLLYVLGRYLFLGYSVPGFPFLASIITIFSGVQLFSLGIIGEYLARMHFRTMDRPAYVIRQATQQLAQPNTRE